MSVDDAIARAAAAIAQADALLFTAGAGMGVDSGLPDFRGDEGFWRAYPPYERLGLSFVDLANPAWFVDDPTLAWGFYGHRLSLYRKTKPHRGFAILRGWAAQKPHGSFVFTSNVDGQFQRAGFDPDRINECHGAIDWVQCTAGCGLGVVSGDRWAPVVDVETFRATEPLPSCPRCGALLRPNVLMFGDMEWDDSRTAEQHGRMSSWLRSVTAGSGRLAIVELGAGTAVPTVRATGERLARHLDGTLVRINVREPECRGHGIELALGALEALERIDALFDAT